MPIKENSNYGHYKSIPQYYLPVWRPLALAALRSRTRLLECTTVGFFMIRPSFSNRAMLRRELANEISLISLGSNQILRLPHLSTDAARRFWSLSDTVLYVYKIIIINRLWEYYVMNAIWYEYSRYARYIKNCSSIDFLALNIHQYKSLWFVNKGHPCITVYHSIKYICCVEIYWHRPHC